MKDIHGKIKQRSEVLTEAEEIKAQITEARTVVNLLRAKLLALCPYPFCSTPEKCAGLGCCPKDPCCAD